MRVDHVADQPGDPGQQRVAPTTRCCEESLLMLRPWATGPGTKRAMRAALSPGGLYGSVDLEAGPAYAALQCAPGFRSLSVANTKSAEKRARQAVERRARNVALRSTAAQRHRARSSTAVNAGNKAEAAAALKAAQPVIDSMVTQGHHSSQQGRAPQEPPRARRSRRCPPSSWMKGTADPFSIPALAADCFRLKRVPSPSIPPARRMTAWHSSCVPSPRQPLRSGTPAPSSAGAARCRRSAPRAPCRRQQVDLVEHQPAPLRRESGLNFFSSATMARASATGSASGSGGAMSTRCSSTRVRCRCFRNRMPRPGALGRALDEPRDVGHHEAALLADRDDAEVRIQRRERIVGDLRPRRRNRADQRRLAGVRQA